VNWTEKTFQDTVKIRFGGDNIQYDPNGNLIEVISPEGYLTVFKYDDANRRIKSILYQPQNGVKLSGSAYCAF